MASDSHWVFASNYQQLPVDRTVFTTGAAVRICKRKVCPYKHRMPERQVTSSSDPVQLGGCGGSEKSTVPCSGLAGGGPGLAPSVFVA